MKKIDYYSITSYIAYDKHGFSLNEAIRLWKTMYVTFEAFEKEIIKKPIEETGNSKAVMKILLPLSEIVKGLWDETVTLTEQEKEGLLKHKI